MKITFKGTFNVDDMRLINDFIETQLTTDAETESATNVKKLDGVEHSYVIGSDVAVIGFDDGSERYYTKIELDRVVLIDVVVNNFGDVEKIHFTKIEK